MESKHAELEDFRGLELYSQDDKKIAKVEDVFLDDRTGVPEWLRLGVGLFGMKDVLVPLQAVSRDGDRLVVSYSSEMVKDAPSVDGDYISPEQESEIYQYYGIAAESPSQLNQDGSEPLNRKDTTESVSGNIGSAPSSDRPGGVSAPEETVFAETGMNDPAQVRLRRWEQ